MVLKSKVGSYQLHKENKNVQNKEIFPYFIFAINSFFVYFYFTKISNVRNIFLSLVDRLHKVFSYDITYLSTS